MTLFSLATIDGVRLTVAAKCPEKAGDNNCAAVPLLMVTALIIKVSPLRS